MAKAPTKKAKQPRKAAGRKPREVEVRTTKSSGAKKQAAKKATKRGSATRSSATTLMGMRVPEGVSNALESLVNSPRGRKLLASALVAAAGAAAAALTNASDSDDRDDRNHEGRSDKDEDPITSA